MIACVEYCGEWLSEFKSPIIGRLVLLVVLLLVTLAVLYLIRRYLIKKSLSKEYWLPIVEDSGRVIGRIARSVSLERPGIYQHPLIRILIYKSGTLYLTPRTYEDCPDLGKYDHPYERMMEYGFSVEETIESMQNEFFPNSHLPKFLLRYKHENAIGRWQVLLYLLSIEDENELVGLDKMNGKFWTIQQIRENVGMSFFSTYLEGEIDFLETLLKS